MYIEGSDKDSVKTVKFIVSFLFCVGSEKLLLFSF